MQSRLKKALARLQKIWFIDFTRRKCDRYLENCFLRNVFELLNLNELK